MVGIAHCEREAYHSQHGRAAVKFHRNRDFSFGFPFGCKGSFSVGG